MPTYRYECESCSHEFELFQSMTEKLKKKCPECGKPKLIRLIGAGAAVIFKGSGFYQTDYKNAGRPGKADSEGGGEANTPDNKTSDKKTPAASDPAAKGDSGPKSEPSPKPDSRPKSDAPGKPAGEKRSGSAPKRSEE